MKELLHTFIVLIIPFTVYSQTIQLNDNPWFIHSIETSNGTITEKPLSPDLNSQLTIDLTANLIIADLCCGGSFQMNLVHDAPNSNFAASNFSNTTVNCTETNNTDFSNLVIDFFNEHLSENFTYSITEENGTVVKLEVLNDEGETLHLYNSPHQNKASKLFHETYGIEWHLTSMEVNGTFTSMTPNSEFGEITAKFNYDGSFETQVCDQLSGGFTLGEGDSFHDFVINCSDLTIGNSDCNDPQNTSIQNNYFNFFSNHSDEILELTFVQIDYWDPIPCEAEVFTLTSASGDYLEFSTCSLLNINEKQQTPITLYPNPTKNYLYFNATNNLPIHQIRILDINGKEIKKYIDVRNKIDISFLSNGVYFFKIKSDQKVMVQKIIKE